MLEPNGFGLLAKKTEIHTIRTKLILSFLVIALIPLASWLFFLSNLLREPYRQCDRVCP